VIRPFSFLDLPNDGWLEERSMGARARLPLLVLLVGCGAAAPSCAMAACSPFTPHTRSVGNKAADPDCTDDTIQSAIDNAICPNTIIVITKERSYTAQHLSVQDKSITLSGSAAACGGGGTTRPDDIDTITAPIVTLDGTGNGGTSVIAVRGNSNVTLQFLELTHGGGGSGSHGGGVDFQGAGSLTLDTSTIDLNSADFGGGIEFSGVGGAATLTLKPYSVIESNKANTNGGGINLEGTATLNATQPFTLIGFNHAPNGQGGGIAVAGPAEADIGSPGYADLPVINGNDAVLGGGMSFLGVDASNANGNVFTTDPLHPVAIAGNFASEFGGAIYAKPHSSFSQPADANICVENARIDGNAAPEGSIAYLDYDSTFIGDVGISRFAFNDGLCGSLPPGSVACAGGVTCNTLNDNRAVDAANHATAGSMILANGDAQARMFRFSMRNNSGLHALRLLNEEHAIGKCLIADNAFTNETISIEDGGFNDGFGLATIDSCTIANNLHNSGSVIHTELQLTLTNSILDQPVMSALSLGGTPTVSAHFVMAADPTGLPVQEDIVKAEPLFVDSTNANVAQRNYHQGAVIQNGDVTSSFAIDYAPPVPGNDLDLDGNPYDQDVPAVPDHLGVRDLGCYEMQPITDRIFADALGDPISLVQ